jgi:hypothetical protein
VGDEFVEPSETGDGMMRWWFIDATQDAGVVRISRSRSRLDSLIAVSAVRACSGSPSIRCRATPAWMLISETW